MPASRSACGNGAAGTPAKISGAKLQLSVFSSAIIGIAFAEVRSDLLPRVPKRDLTHKNWNLTMQTQTLRPFKRLFHASAAAVALSALALTPAAGRAETVTAEPDAYLDYIEATGSQYIDTGVNAETGLKARVDFAWASGNISGNDWSLLDAAIDNTVSDKRNRFLMCHLYGGGGKPFFGYGVRDPGSLKMP